jgi:alanine-glyoxylate transaminase/serine-glyoxylate transaminase/serine-pyruvate transaminase
MSGDREEKTNTMDTNRINPPQRVLLGPGPSNVDPQVLMALSNPPVGHLDPYLLELFTEEQRLLRAIFKTGNDWTFALSGTGTSGMEAALANLIEPGDRMLVAINGYFGARLAEIAGRLGAQVDRMECPLGNIFSVDEIEAALQKRSYKVFGTVHAETSTGAEQLNIKEISNLVHQNNALFILDTVTSLAGIPVEVDEWDIDIAYSASQKSISAPSGLAPITVSSRAQKNILERSTPVSSFYLDLKAYANYWGGSHVYHHTTSASLHYALLSALKLIEEEGLETRFKRFMVNAQFLWEGLEKINCAPFIPIQHRLPVLTTALVPPSVNPDQVRNRLLAENNIEIAAGFGDLRNKVWRIGLMGYSSSPENVSLLLSAMGKLLG